MLDEERGTLENGNKNVVLLSLSALSAATAHHFINECARDDFSGSRSCPNLIYIPVGRV